MAEREGKFFRDNPMGSESARQLYQEQLNRKDVKSPLVYLSQRMFEYSREGLREIQSRLERDFPVKPDYVIGAMVLNEGMSDVSSLVLSAVYPELIYAEENGIFSIQNVVDTVNEGIRGTFIPSFFLPVGASPIEELSTERWQLLKSAKKRDESLSNAFVHRTALPNSFISFIDEYSDAGYSESSLWQALQVTIEKWRSGAHTYLDENGLSKPLQARRTLGQAVQEQPLRPGSIPSTEDDLRALDFSEDLIKKLADLKKRHRN